MAEGPPAAVRPIARIAARFGVVVREEPAARAVPVVGAALGAAIDLLFVSRFQKTASGRFAVRRLERKYGPDVVKAACEAMARSRRERQREPWTPGTSFLTTTTVTKLGS